MANIHRLSHVLQTLLKDSCSSTALMQAHTLETQRVAPNSNPLQTRILGCPITQNRPRQATGPGVFGKEPVREVWDGKRVTGANAAIISLRIITHRAPTMLFIKPKQAASQTEPHGNGAGMSARGPSLTQTGHKPETWNLFCSILGWTGASPPSARWISSH